MRKGLLALLGVLTVSAGLSRAQTVVVSPYLPSGSKPNDASALPTRPAEAAAPVQENEAAALPARPAVVAAPVQVVSTEAGWLIKPPEGVEPIRMVSANGAVPGMASECCGTCDGSSERFWVSADYLLWWTKHSPMPVPVATVGSINDVIPGALGEPGTRVIFGGSDINYDSANGGRISLGVRLDPEGKIGLEGSYFLLERQASTASVASDGTGNPILALPFFDPAIGREDSVTTSFPGEQTGSIAIATHMRLQGWNVDVAANALCRNDMHLDVLAGFRSVYLDEDLQVVNSFSPLLDDGFITFLNAPVAPGSTVTTHDSFSTQNHFYGPEIGGRLEWKRGMFTVSVLGKVAVGVNQQLVQINGSSTLATPGVAPQTVPAGVLAVSSNTGRFFRDEVSVLPEVGVRLSVQITDNLSAHVGYTLLWWDNVVRPGDTVDHSVEPALVPTIPIFGTATPGAHPAFQFRNTDFWAQGADVGLTVSY
jgi:hypothetical protein